MNKGNQDSSSRNLPEFAPEQSRTTSNSEENQSISLSEPSNLLQETVKSQDEESLLQSPFQHQTQTLFPENLTDLVPEQTECAASFAENQSASIHSSQQLRRPSDNVILRQNRLQHNLQKDFSENTLESISEWSERTVRCEESPSTSISNASNCLSLQIYRNPTDISLMQNQFQSYLQSPFFVDTPTFQERPSASTSGALSFFSQPTNIYDLTRDDAFRIRNQFQHHMQTTSSENIPVYVPEWLETTTIVGGNKTVSIPETSSSFFQHRASIPEWSRRNVRFDASPSTSTSNASSCFSLQIYRSPTDISLMQNRVKSYLQSPFIADTPIFYEKLENFHDRPSTSTSDALSFFFQPTNIYDLTRDGAFRIRNQFQHHMQTTSSENTPVYMPEWLETTAIFGANQTVSIPKASSSFFQHRASIPESVRNVRLNEIQSASTSNASSCLSLQIYRGSTDISLLQNRFQSFIRSPFFGDTSSSFHESPEYTESFCERPSEVSRFLFQPTDINYPTRDAESTIRNQFQHHMQTISCENTPVFYPEANVIFGGNQIVSTSGTSSSLFEQGGICLTVSSFLQTFLRPFLQEMLSKNTLTFFPEWSGTTLIFDENPATFTSEVSSSFLRQANNVSNLPILQSTLQNPQASFSRSSPASVPEFLEIIPSFFENPKKASNFHSQQIESFRTIVPLLNLKKAPTSHSQQIENFPTIVSLLKAPSKHNMKTSFQESGERFSTEKTFPSKKQVTSSQKKKTFTSPPNLKKYETAEHFKQKTRTHFHPSDTTASAEQTTASRPRKQKNISFSPIKETSATKEHINAASPRQKRTTLFSRSSRQQVTVENPTHKKKVLSSPVKTATTSKEQITAMRSKQKKDTSFLVEMSAPRQQLVPECPKQHTESHPIPGEPKMKVVHTSMYVESKDPEFKDETTDFFQARKEFSETSKRTTSIHQQQSSASSHEYYLYNPSSRHSNKDTEVEKYVDKLEKRLGMFDKFICVKCLAEFDTQDELLRHEPIHFND